MQIELPEKQELTNTHFHAADEHSDQINNRIKSSSLKITKPIKKLSNSVKKRARKLYRSFNDHVNKNNNNYGYLQWIDQYDMLTDIKRSAIQTTISQMTELPLISILLPVYNPLPKQLHAAMRSVKEQLYPNWELCIADDNSTDKRIKKLIKKYAANDHRIKYLFRKENGHISDASNSALELVTGEYTALLDHDDLLTPDALYWVATEIINYPDSAIIYSDEDKLTPDGKRCDPYFKCDFNYSLFLSHNLISHLGVYKTPLLRDIGGFRKGFEGSQDYDLALRIIETVSTSLIRHIPKVLYHWRIHKKSTSLLGEVKPYAHLAALKSVNDHLQRMKIAAVAEPAPGVPGMNRIRYRLPLQPPSVAIIILTRDKAELIKKCIESILIKTTYPNYSITIVDNGSEEKETLELFSSWKTEPRISIIRDDSAFNYSRLNNNTVKRTEADFVCLMNNDIEVITSDWLDEMMGLALQKRTGAVGARLWYPDDTLQHGGVILGMGGIAGHAGIHLKKGSPGYFGRACLQQDISAVTGACLLVQRAHYLKIEGLDEINLTVAFNDVDFCLKLREIGLHNQWTPYAELYHHESASRGKDNTPEKEERFNKEIAYMLQQWKKELQYDPAYSPNLTLQSNDFAMAWPPRTAY